MKILVTGGAGFIGTNFVFACAERGDEVVVLDKLTYAGGKDNLAALGDKVQLIVADICDRESVRKTLQGIDWVAHWAAESHVTRSETDPDIFYRTNVGGTKVMLEEAQRAGIERFLHISTDEIYGPIVSGFFKEEDKIKGAGQASSAYARSKSSADDLAMEFGEQGLPIIVMRPTNNFGPWQFPEKALPRWITELLSGKKIPLWGEGKQIRDWLYATLTAQAGLFLLEKGAPGEAYNVAANHQPEITNRQAAEWLCEILGKNADEWIEQIPDPRPHHDFRYALDTGKIKKLGWQPRFDIKKQFTETAQWYQNNQNWWKKRKQEAERIYRS